MTYNAGTATDHLDLLDQLIEVVTSRHLSVLAVNAGGTGHAIGDIVDIAAAGSTSTHVCQVEVVTLSGSAIATARIYRGGAYTVDPTTTTANAQSATTGSGTGATFDLTFAPTGWSQLARQSIAASATVAAGGSGHVVSDVLTLIGGVLANGGSAATFTVATLGGGSDVATVTLLAAGDYEVFPPDAVLTSSDGSGVSCTLNVTWDDKAGETVVVLQGDAGASIDPLVGIKTYSSETDETGANTVYNWALFGMTTWSSLSPLHQQPNVSDGFNTGADDGTITISTTGDGAFVPLKDADAFDIEWEIRATGRSVVLIAKVEGASTVYQAHAAFGLLNQFGISSELPFPAFVAGSSDRKRAWYRDTSSIWGGLSLVLSRANGPMFVWSPEGSWLAAKVGLLGANQSTTPTFNPSTSNPRVQVWPLGESAVHNVSEDALWVAAAAAGFDNDDLTLATNAIQIYRTPDTGGDLFPLYPVTIVQALLTGSVYRTFGEIDGVFWFSDNDAAVSSEDRFTQGGVAHSIYQNGTQIDPYAFLALRED